MFADSPGSIYPVFLLSTSIYRAVTIRDFTGFTLIKPEREHHPIKLTGRAHFDDARLKKKNFTEVKKQCRDTGAVPGPVCTSLREPPAD